jgi:hypothetical protein
MDTLAPTPDDADASPTHVTGLSSDRTIPEEIRVVDGRPVIRGVSFQIMHGCGEENNGPYCCKTLRKRQTAARRVAAKGVRA